MKAIIKKILPICSFCRKIRDKAGCWWSCELNGREQEAVMFSHTVCPECMKREYPEFIKEAWQEQKINT
jgi:hypothetical protein